MRTQVEYAVQQNGLSNEFFFHGNVNNVEQWLCNSHIYLHTAWYEPFGLVFLEAMAAGLPCVTLNGKGNRDLFENGINGFIIEKQNAKEFADKILELYNNPSLYKKISASGQLFAKKYDIKKVADEYIEFYHLLLKSV